MGSSPRLRGTQYKSGLQLVHSRFIPASAGNTSHPSSILYIRSVHPRVCGEHPSTRTLTASINGSSPRLRGTLAIPEILHPAKRFIPASAGNTAPLWCRTRLPAVHPRVCGEHRLTVRKKWDFGGSSPRLRGTLTLQVVDELVLRFIPASAGNTYTPVFCGCNYAVHPRVCGEHVNSLASAAQDAGSSPRLRGTLSTGPLYKRFCRFIPASAGNTASMSSCSITSTVHPRVCGEHYAAGGVVDSPTGSSPRLRGTLMHMLEHESAERFIPASAGNTWRPSCGC